MEILKKLCNQNTITARAYLKEIIEFIPEQSTDLVKAMNYAVGDAGKMIRSTLMMLIANLFGIKTERILPAVAALELIHNYSLVHDDLPALDNDDVRRGRPSCHKKFGEANAILVGDGLLTMAFGEITKLQNYGFDTKKILACIEVLSYCAGPFGMIMGQVLDLDYGQATSRHNHHESEEYDNQELANIKQIHTLKTGMLFSAATKIAAILASKTRNLDDYKEFIKFAENFGLELGKLFQIYDDIDDISYDSGPNIAILLGSEKLEHLIFDTKAKIQEYASKLFNDSMFYTLVCNLNYDIQNKDNYIEPVTKTQQFVEFIFDSLRTN